ncbi:MAG: AI-2E family transporter [Planctomycetota bacterium]
MSQQTPSDTESQTSAGDPPPHWTQKHIWQIQPVRDVLVVALLLWLLYLGSVASVVTVPLLLALLLAYLFEPIIQKLSRWRRLSRAASVRLILIATLGVLFIPAILGIGAAVAQGYDLADSLAQRAASVRKSVENPDNTNAREAVPPGPWRMLRDRIVEIQTELAIQPPPENADTEPEAPAEDTPAPAPARAGRGGPSIESLALQWLEQNAQGVVRSVARTGADAFSVLAGFFGSLAAFGFGAFLTLFFFFFIATGWPSVVHTVREVIPSKHEDRIGELLGKMDRVVSGFVRGRLTISVVLAVFFVVAYAIIGVPAPLLVGGLVAVLSLIPYASLLGLPITMILLWLEGYTGLRGSTPWVILAPVVVYAIAQLLDDYLLTPLIQGKETDLDIPSVLFATLAGGALFGFYGLLIAIPLAACIKILFLEFAWPHVKAWAKGDRKDLLPLSS